MRIDETTYLNAARGGDQEAFAQLIDPYRHQILVHCYRILGSFEDAEDMLQDLVIKAMSQGEKFCEISNARAWLFEVARNAVADRFRLQREMIELPADLVSETEESAAVDSLTACLPRVLSELSPEDREAITLCDLEGLPQEEYARRKGLSLPGAKSRVQRARKLHVVDEAAAAGEQRRIFEARDTRTEMLRPHGP